MKNQLQLTVLALLCPLLIHAQWTPQWTGFDTPLRGIWDIHIADANTAWALAYDGNLGIFNHVPEFTRTVDGGLTWIPANFPEGYVWSNIFALDGNTAWVSAVAPLLNYEGAILKTTDGGMTWDEQGENEIYGTGSYVNEIYFWNPNDGVVIGDPNPTDFEIYTTIDGGATWDIVPGKVIPDPIAGEFAIFRNYTVFEDHIWFATNRYRVFHSPDKGFTWTVGNTGLPPNSISNVDIAFWNENEGIARSINASAGTNLGVAKTTDGGATWNPLVVNGTLFGSAYSGIAYVPGTTSTLVSTGVQGILGSSYSNDGGNNWITIDTTVGHYITRFWDSTTGWSGHFNYDSLSGIHKYTGDPVGIKNTENGKDISFGAYPNPGNGHITIQLSNGENADLELSVIDINGKVVYQNNYSNPGEFFMRGIDLTKLPGGVYFIRLENGVLLHTEKIIIQKE